MLYNISFFNNERVLLFYLSSRKIFFPLIFLLLVLVSFFLHFKIAHSDILDKKKYCNDTHQPIEKYACLVEHASKGISLDFEAAGMSLSTSQISILKAIEAMNLVQNIAGSGRYAYLHRTGNLNIPNEREQDICLINGFGICGNHQLLFIDILKKTGVKAKPVDFYYSINGLRQSHAAAEVYTGNKWVYFDITWGSYWLSDAKDLFSLESLDEVLDNKGIQITGNNSWYVATIHKFSKLGIPNIFSYLKAEDLQVLKNKGGDLIIALNDGKADFSDRPNYFGKPPIYSPIKLKLSKDTPSAEAIIDIVGIGGDCKDSYIKVNSKHLPIKAGETVIHISPNTTIEIEGDYKICYGVLAGLKIKQ